MIVRQQQMEALARVAEDRYVSTAVAHLEAYDPPLAAAAGQAALEKLAREGLASARDCGFSENRPLQLYLELMMSLGSGFATDPQFRWLLPHLNPKDRAGALNRARLLHFHATAYLDRAYGPKREFGRVALERAATLTSVRMRQLGEDLDSGGELFLRWLHPERIDFIDQQAVKSLVAGARKEATEYRLPLEGAAVAFLLKFAFGHRVLSDPAYAWLARNLEPDGVESASLRVERLLARFQVHADETRRYLERASF